MFLSFFTFSYLLLFLFIYLLIYFFSLSTLGAFKVPHFSLLNSLYSLFDVIFCLVFPLIHLSLHLLLLCLSNKSLTYTILFFLPFFSSQINLHHLTPSFTFLPFRLTYAILFFLPLLFFLHKPSSPNALLHFSSLLLSS